MRIGIDIDGVLTNLQQFSVDYFTKFCYENNIKYSITCENFDYDIYKSFGLGKKEEDAFWEEYLDYYATDEKAREFASEVIDILKKQGHEIYIITARWLTNRDDECGEKTRNIVKKWLKKNKIHYDKLVFSKASKERKLQEMTEHNIDIMIEDSPYNINEISSLIPVICFDAPYNNTCGGGNITRCYSWYDILTYINKLNRNILF